MLWFEELLKITLASFRVGGLFLAMPVFGAGPLPGPVKFFVAVSIAMMMLPFQKAIPPEVWSRNGLLILMIARELGLGILMGFGARFIFLVVSMSLEVAGLQIGFSIANIFDPQNNSQISILAQLGVVLMVLFFFAANLHHDLFRALARSYELYPMGIPDWEMGLMKERILGFLRASFELSIRLAFPVLLAMLVVHVMMGVISRTAPQMNLFFNAAFALNVVAGLVLIALTMPQMFRHVQRFSNVLLAHGYGLW